jgi:hypothetical protein
MQGRIRKTLMVERFDVAVTRKLTQKEAFGCVAASLEKCVPSV